MLLSRFRCETKASTSMNESESKSKSIRSLAVALPAAENSSSVKEVKVEEDLDERPFSQHYEVLSQLTYDEPLQKEELGYAGTGLLDAPKEGLTRLVARASKPIKKQRKRERRKSQYRKREEGRRFTRGVTSERPLEDQSKQPGQVQDFATWAGMVQYYKDR